MEQFDQVIVGGGLAGTVLAWNLRWAGRRVLLLDRGEPGTASRIAAGLITPITGQRLVKTWGLDEFYPAAVAFYRRVEAETGEVFLTERNSVRLFIDAAERAAFEARLPAIRDHVREAPPIDAAFCAPLGGFEMTPAAQLDVRHFLDASHAHFDRDGGFRRAEFDPVRDPELTDGGVRLPRLGVAARGVVFCQGIAARENPWCGHLRFNPAKGEILTLRIPGLVERRVVHRGVWLAPVGEDVFRAGSTYVWDRLDTEPTATGREEIAARLRTFLRMPFEGVGHAAAVRPVLHGGKPVVGLHPEHPQLAVFNGLGSKGTLLAPTSAARLAGLLTARDQV